MKTQVDATALPAWLAEQTASYERDPSLAESLLDRTLQVFSDLAAAAPGPMAVELALFINCLAADLRAPETLAPQLRRCLDWCEPRLAARQEVEFLCARMRLCLQIGHWLEAGADLERALALARVSQDPIDMGLSLAALSLSASRQRDWRSMVEHAREAIAWFKCAQYPGPWVSTYAALAVGLRELHEQAARRAALDEGMAVCVGQRRWSEAANLCSGLVDMELEAGELDAAEAWLARGLELVDRIQDKQLTAGHHMMALSRARCLAARGDFPQACDLAEEALARPWRFNSPAGLSLRLNQLADWLACSGQGERALRAARRANQLEYERLQRASQHENLLQHQRMELAHAEALRLRSAAQAVELEAQHAALEQAIELQRELQDELIESSKLASLSHLLAGMAHELNTPLGTALTAISTSVDLGRSLHGSISAGALTRSRLLADLDASLQGQQLARQGLQRALELVAGYRQLHAIGGPPPCSRLSLAALVQAAWQRALLPGHALSLELDVDLELALPAEALSEVLLQLFQNVERHAYAPGQAGWVRVQAHRAEAQVVLSVSDGGRGIAPELLPRVFEPYVSSQFGRGRSGLGLFVAQAGVKQQLGGRIRALNPAGGGACFEMVWPMAS